PSLTGWPRRWQPIRRNCWASCAPTARWPHAALAIVRPSADENAMKLGSMKHGRDGRLVVVSDDLAWHADARHIAPTLQAALDDWASAEPALRLLATDLAHGAIPRERFHEREADAPLPRAYQWADGSAYVNHVALVRQARGARSE